MKMMSEENWELSKKYLAQWLKDTGRPGTADEYLARHGIKNITNEILAEIGKGGHGSDVR
jgi:hypothetical protein